MQKCAVFVNLLPKMLCDSGKNTLLCIANLEIKIFYLLINIENYV
jgi:hypothetical protein